MNGLPRIKHHVSAQKDLGWALVVVSVIPATQEAEIRRITVQSQPRQTVLKDPILEKPFTKKGWWSGSR
jgi:hypothetical protein